MSTRDAVNSPAMPRSLVIVESPTKARTIKAFLDSDATVESSMGHIRDLPRSASEIPARVKDEDWARLGVNVENDFEPLYVVSKERKKQVKKLKELIKEADELYLATDEDREGEAIAWHLVEVLKRWIGKVPALGGNPSQFDNSGTDSLLHRELGLESARQPACASAASGFT